MHEQRLNYDGGRIGFGAWPIGQKELDDGSIGGSYGAVPPDQARRVVERYVELGGTFIDTARAYGTSETIIGECAFMRIRRDELFIASKSHHTSRVDQLPEIERDLEKTLRNLGTDYLDLYQIHSPPDDPDLMMRVLERFARLRERGLIRAVGASVRGPDVTPGTVALAKRYVDTGMVDALQLVYSMFRRRHEETFEHAAANGVAVIARTVLESGFLSGKYGPGDSFTGHRSRWGAERRPVLLRHAASLRELVEPPFESLAQAAERFALERPEVTVIIPGARTVEQVEANLRVAGLPPLPSRLREAVDELPDKVQELANTGS